VRGSSDAAQGSVVRDPEMIERLQKILSQAGVTSRRKAEELIVAGRVTVNGETVTELGSKADLEHDHIKVDGQPLRPPKRHVYLALNKPKGCVTTVSDPEGRETVMHMLRGVKERVFPVGRLDYHSEGLLLFTNDGEFAHRITAPESHVKKTYVVKVTGPLTEEQERQFREGIPLHGRKTSPAELKRIKPGANPWYEVRITEGRQNQIRVMFKHFGRLVEKLRRVKIAFLELDQAPGRYRPLTQKEVERFRKLLKIEEGAEPPTDHEIRAKGGNKAPAARSKRKEKRPEADSGVL
jgi:23S rRNA pseudouridine2605 synthase